MRIKRIVPIVAIIVLATTFMPGTLAARPHSVAHHAIGQRDTSSRTLSAVGGNRARRATPLYNLTGRWTASPPTSSTNYSQITMDASTGAMTGTASVSGTSFTLGGSEDGSGNVTITLSCCGSYVSTIIGKVVDNGNCMSGTWKDTGGSGGAWGPSVRNGAAAVNGQCPSETVTSVKPNHGSVAQEAKLTITGMDLKGETRVDLLPPTGPPIAATNVSCPTETTCTAVTPRSLGLITSPGAKVRTDVLVAGPKGTTRTNRPGDEFTFDPVSVLQLGDSIASGEGTLYGFTYDNQDREWKGPANKNPAWSGSYPLCHESPDAYGNLVAKNVNATFLQLACTGATFFNGIAGPNVDPDTMTQRGPAQFGNWVTGKDLNPQYEEFNPDVVLVTLGADDIHFADIVADCIASTVIGHGPERCIPSNPGAIVQHDFFDNLSPLENHLGLLAQWIEERSGKADPAKSPKIVFTNYYDPFPPPGEKCPDTWRLTPKQIDYLSARVKELDSVIQSTIAPLTGNKVGFVDLSQAYAGHEWCSNDPWAYGLSIDSILSHDNPAPFHPTPVGQAKIAKLVIPEVNRLLNSH